MFGLFLKSHYCNKSLSNAVFFPLHQVMTFRLTESESFRYCKTRDSDVGLSVVILPSNMACQIFIAKLFMSLRHDDFSCLLKFQAKIYNHMLFPISFIKRLLIYYHFLYSGRATCTPFKEI